MNFTLNVRKIKMEPTDQHRQGLPQSSYLHLAVRFVNKGTNSELTHFEIGEGFRGHKNGYFSFSNHHFILNRILKFVTKAVCQLCFTSILPHSFILSVELYLSLNCQLHALVFSYS